MKAYMIKELHLRPKADLRQISHEEKLEVFARAGMRCEMCKKEFKDHKEAEYHHIDMYVYGGPSETDNIMLLCTSCHDEIHQIKIPGDSLTEKDLDEEEK